jgi:hypothetical protein
MCGLGVMRGSIARCPLGGAIMSSAPARLSAVAPDLESATLGRGPWVVERFSTAPEHRS